jgi:surface protein
MAIQNAQARLYNAFQARVVDKSGSAALVSEFKIGHRDLEDPTIILDDVLPTRVLRNKFEFMNSTSSLAAQGELPIKGGVVNATSRSRLTAAFPTFIRIDIDALSLPEGRDVTLQLEEGFVIEQTDKFPFALGGPNAANNNFVTFRVPYKGNAFLNSLFNKTFIPLKIRQLSSTDNKIQATLSALPIINPGQLAALFAGNFITLTNAVKTARIGRVLFSEFDININAGVLLDPGLSNFGSEFILTPPDLFRLRFGNVNLSSETIKIVEIEQIKGVINQNIVATSTMNVEAVKTTSSVGNLTSVTSLLLNPGRIRPFNSNISSAFDLSVPIIFTPLVLEYIVGTDSQTFNINFTGTVDVVVEWGDGTQNTYTTAGTLSKFYSFFGTRVVTIRGTADTISFNFGTSGISASGLTICRSFGNVVQNSISFTGEWFVSVPPKLPSNITSTTGMFGNCRRFNDNNVTLWDMSNVQFINSMFRTCLAFNRPVGSWNTSNVERMSAVFDGCIVFNQPLNSWDTSNVYDMSAMFRDARRFNQPLNSWDTSAIGSQLINPNTPGGMGSMFQGAQDFNQDISSWCVQAIPTKPFGFDSASGAITTNPDWTEDKKPNWGAPC